MPFNIPFPFFYNNYKYRYPSTLNNSFYHKNSSFNTPENTTKNTINNNCCEIEDKKKTSESIDASEAFFELFGLKLYFDDVLIICILFFLYTEKVKNDELFICLILLLLT